MQFNKHYKAKIFLLIILVILASLAIYYSNQYQQNSTSANSETGSVITLSENLSFNIPKDCQKFMRFIKDQNPYKTADQATFNEMQNGEMICKYENLKNTGNPTAPNDFVGKIDFANGSLDNLPYAMFCAGGFGSEIMSREDMENDIKFKKEVCDKLAQTNANYSLIDMALLEQKDVWNKKISDANMKAMAKEVQSLPRDKDCHFTNSKFHGEIKIEDGIVKCPPIKIDEDGDEDSGFNIYIYRLQFTDFNKDGFLDAIISTSSPSSGSASSSPTYQIVTKKDINQERLNLLYPSKFSQDDK